MKLSEIPDTVEDLLEYLIAEGKTVALQRLRQAMEGERFDLDDFVISLAEEGNGDETRPLSMPERDS